MTPWLGRKKKGETQRFNKEGDTIKTRYPDGKVYLIPLGDFAPADGTPSVSALLEYTSLFWQLPCVLLEPVSLIIEGDTIYAAAEAGTRPKKSRRRATDDIAASGREKLVSRSHSSGRYKHRQLKIDVRACVLLIFHPY